MDKLEKVPVSSTSSLSIPLSVTKCSCMHLVRDCEIFIRFIPELINDLITGLLAFSFLPLQKIPYLLHLPSSSNSYCHLLSLCTTMLSPCCQQSEVPATLTFRALSSLDHDLLLQLELPSSSLWSSTPVRWIG
jgi:hypothetical protein